jgi:hypothetical protein
MLMACGHIDSCFEFRKGLYHCPSKKTTAFWGQILTFNIYDPGSFLWPPAAAARFNLCGRLAMDESRSADEQGSRVICWS